MKKRNTEQFEEAKIIGLKQAADDTGILFYRAPAFKYFYIFIPTQYLKPNATQQETFETLFPKAIKIANEKEFDRLIRLNPAVEIITVADDYFLDMFPKHRQKKVAKK